MYLMIPVELVNEIKFYCNNFKSVLNLQSLNNETLKYIRIDKMNYKDSIKKMNKQVLNQPKYDKF